MTASVSVIVTVQDSTTHLATTLGSLERQTIGFEHLQVLLVIDESTHDARAVVDEFAARHPDHVVVVHEPSPSTPAARLNRGLDRATGRWVYFLGSGDVLTEDALQVLVEHGDRRDCDVVLGRVEPAGGDAPPEGSSLRATVVDVDLHSESLPVASADSLVRRSLVDGLALRYREDMRSRWERPFIVTASIHARRISVVESATSFIRPRADRSDVTSTVDAADAYAATAIILETIAAQVPPGSRRDHLMRPHFLTMIRDDLGASLSRRELGECELAYERFAELSRRFLTDSLYRGMNALDRATARAALDRDTERALALLALSTGEHAVDLHVEGGRAFLTYPGFDPDSDHRDAYEITHERPLDQIAALFSPARVAIEDDLVVVRGTVGIRGSLPHRGRLVRAASAPSRAVCATRSLERGRRVTARVQDGTYRLTIDVRSLSRRVFRPSIMVEIHGEWYDVPLPYEGSRTLRPGPLRRKLGVAHADEAGHLVLDLG